MNDELLDKIGDNAEMAMLDLLVNGRDLTPFEELFIKKCQEAEANVIKYLNTELWT